MGSRMWVWGGGPQGNEFQVGLFSLWIVIGWITILWIGVSAYLIIALILLLSCFIMFPCTKLREIIKKCSSK